jgi:hypothetical protein
MSAHFRLRESVNCKGAKFRLCVQERRNPEKKDLTQSSQRESTEVTEKKTEMHPVGRARGLIGGPPRKEVPTTAIQEMPSGEPDPRATLTHGAPTLLFHAVVGCFFGDDYVVDVGFAEAGGGDADELAFFG